MAYCKNCGAYVPDGHTKCLACGLDQNEDQNKKNSSGSATQTAPRQGNRQNQEELRRRMEEQRKKQQEDSRRWAEAERQRRQQEQQEEARRREAETEGTAAWSQAAGNTARPKAYQPNKLLAALSYLSVLFILPYIFCKDDKYATFHARQGAILFAVTAVGEVLGSAFGLGWIVTLMHLYWIYKGMINASNGKVEPLPYIGNLFSGR